MFFSLVFEILVQNKENSLNVKRQPFYFYKKNKSQSISKLGF
ncbi:hypothetical protein NU08_4371 [Flavobacterium anhuiense]|uniref:Uncharacterized protein n=1 Tax=Flavobacterium anhuiense TaxID=459526 RepID=A0A444VT52_9FLAO|nr:hypothetical protein NU08_4371 [Flavobacterium anhuiense]